MNWYQAVAWHPKLSIFILLRKKKKVEILKTWSIRKQRTEVLKIKFRREVIIEGDEDQMK